MRIEDSYSFPAPPEQVMAALADADTLGSAIPGCERLIQFGPPAADGTRRYEARLRLHDAVYIAYLTVTQRPEASQLRLHVEGRGPGGAFHGIGALTLSPTAGEQPHTLGAYILDLQEPPGLSDVQLAALANGTGRLFACALCDQVSEDLRARDERAVTDEDAADERLRAGRVEQLMRTKTAYGEIIAVPHEPTAAVSPVWFQYTVGMLAGLAVGVSIIALTAATMRRLFTRDEPESK